MRDHRPFFCIVWRCGHRDGPPPTPHPQRDLCQSSAPVTPGRSLTPLIVGEGSITPRSPPICRRPGPRNGPLTSSSGFLHTERSSRPRIRGAYSFRHCDEAGGVFRPHEPVQRCVAQDRWQIAFFQQSPRRARGPSIMEDFVMTRYQQLYQQHQAALAELEAAKRRCRNPVLRGGVTDPATLAAFTEAEEEIKRWSARCSELAHQLAACDPTT
jgi:hypothetical protein